MKVSKTSGAVQVSGVQINIDSEALADAIGKAVARELAPLLSLNHQSKPLYPGPMTDPRDYIPVEIDESVMDVGVSTEGIKKAGDEPLAKETETSDNIRQNLDKLKKLKGK